MDLRLYYSQMDKESEMALSKQRIKELEDLVESLKGDIESIKESYLKEKTEMMSARSKSAMSAV